MYRALDRSTLLLSANSCRSAFQAMQAKIGSVARQLLHIFLDAPRR